MSTPCVIALPDGRGGFRGREVYANGHPDQAGAHLLQIVRRDGLDKAARVLIHDNDSWQEINASQSGHDDQSDLAIAGYGYISLHGADEWFTAESSGSQAWAYILQPKGIEVWANHDGRWLKSYTMLLTSGSGSSSPATDTTGTPNTRSTPFYRVNPYSASGVVNSLEARARVAARNRAISAGAIAVRDRDWRRREITAIRLACRVLGVDPSTVSAVADHDRYALFGWVDVRLIITDHPQADPGLQEPDGTAYEFLCEPAEESSEALLLLRPCPECHHKVPTYCIRTLADLGEVMLADRATPFHRLRPDARQYPTDPGHHQDCPLYRRIPSRPA